jgi:hypothetical protein
VKYINYDDLMDLGACSGELELFKKLFGIEAKISRRNLRKALQHDMSIEVLRGLLPKDKHPLSDEVLKAWDEEIGAIYDNDNLSDGEKYTEDCELDRKYQPKLAWAVFRDLKRG